MSDLIFNGDSLRGIINDAEDINYNFVEFMYAYMINNMPSSELSSQFPNWDTISETERKEAIRTGLTNAGINFSNVKEALDYCMQHIMATVNARQITYSHSMSGLQANDVQSAIDELASRTKILTQTLGVNMTSVTFTNVPVDKNYIMDFFTSRPMDYEDIEDSLYQSQQKITVTFPENTTGDAVQVYCKLEAIS